MANETPSPLGAKRCLAWINACKEMGWPKSAIPKLVDIFWEFKDRDGNLKGESPSLETPAAHKHEFTVEALGAPAKCWCGVFARDVPNR